MYITSLKLENIRCFKSLRINFEKLGSSILILGDNGDGKSTVLRSLALGLCDESSASALFREIDATFVRRENDEEEPDKPKKGLITIDLDDHGERYQIKTTITSSNGLETLSQNVYKFDTLSKPVEMKQGEFPWGEILVSAYGAGIRIQGGEDFTKYSSLNSVLPLFKYDAWLQNSELIVRRLIDSARQSTKDPDGRAKREKVVRQRLKELLKDTLNLKSPDDVQFASTSIRVKGKWGETDLRELGDGYRAMATVVLDLIAWWYLKAVPSIESAEDVKWFDLNLTEFSGIVIIDEIEQHLHPIWQRTVLHSLQSVFPKIQLIATTHSPLCVVGATDFKDEDIDVVILRPDLDENQLKTMDPPRRQRIDQILTSPFFSVARTMSADISQDISRYSQLKSLSSSSEEERREMELLRENLENAFPAGTTDIQIAVERAVEKVIWEETSKLFDDADPDKDSVRYEIRRQIQKLFGEQSET